MLSFIWNAIMQTLGVQDGKEFEPEVAIVL